MFCWMSCTRRLHTRSYSVQCIFILQLRNISLPYCPNWNLNPGFHSDSNSHQVWNVAAVAVITKVAMQISNNSTCSELLPTARPVTFRLSDDEISHSDTSSSSRINQN